MTFNKFITSASDLVTTHEATRAGFLSIALEKNRVSDPYVKIALCFKTRVTGVKSPDAVLNEVTNALKQREEHGDLNNDGIIRMVQGYFTELAFVYAEIYRVCAPGATIAFVNDNVRYGGEVIPVDFLSSLLAEQFGFIVEKIYCLRQRKGNSSQQMAKFGKVSLRKSITIWKKECPPNKC